MAGMVAEEREKQKSRATAADAAVTARRGAGAPVMGVLDADVEMLMNEEKAFQEFAAGVSGKGQKWADSPFMTVRGSVLRGKNGTALKGGSITVFDGAVLDLSKARLIGHKKIFGKPWAEGSGGILTLMPKNVGGGFMISMDSLKLTETSLSGEAKIPGGLGLRGTEKKLTAEGLELEDEQILFQSPSVVNSGDGSEDLSAAEALNGPVGVKSEGLFPEALGETLGNDSWLPAAKTPEMIHEEELRKAETLIDASEEADQGLIKNLAGGKIEMEGAGKGWWKPLLEYSRAEIRMGEDRRSLEVFLYLGGERLRLRDPYFTAGGADRLKKAGQEAPAKTRAANLLGDSSDKVILKAQGILLKPDMDTLRFLAGNQADENEEVKNAFLSLTGLTLMSDNRLLFQGGSLERKGEDDFAQQPKTKEEIHQRELQNTQVQPAPAGIKSEIIKTLGPGRIEKEGSGAKGKKFFLPYDRIEIIKEKSEEGQERLKVVLVLRGSGTRIELSNPRFAAGGAERLENMGKPAAGEAAAETEAELAKKAARNLSGSGDSAGGVILEAEELLLTPDGDDLNTAIAELVSEDIETENAAWALTGLKLLDSNRLLFNGGGPRGTISHESGVSLSVGGDSVRIGFGTDLVGEAEEDEEDEKEGSKKNEFGFGEFVDLLSEISSLLFPEEDETEDENEDENLTIPLAEIPILPGIQFSAALEPSIHLGLKLTAGAENLSALRRKDVKNQAVSQAAEDLSEGRETTLDFGMALVGGIELALTAGLEAGVPVLFNISGGLRAEAGLNGGGENKEILSAGAALHLARSSDNKLQCTGMNLNLAGGLNFTGSVGASIQREFLGWSKTLASVQFAEWKIAEISAKMNLVNNTGGRGLLSLDNWQTGEEGNIFSARAFGGIFEKANPRENMYGLRFQEGIAPHEIDLSQGASYQENQELFEEALMVLREFQKQEKQVFIGANEAGAQGQGISSMALAVQEAAERFKNALESSSGLMREYEEDLVSFINSPAYKSVENAISTHKSRIAAVETARDAGEDMGSAYEAAGGGGGFKRDLRRKAARELTTSQKLIQYETERIAELEKPYELRASALNAFAAENGIEPDEKSSRATAALLQIYKKNGGKDLLNHLTRFVDLGSVLAYEKERKDQLEKKHADRIAGLKTELSAMTQEEQEKPNGPFIRNYVENMNARQMLSILKQFAGKDRLLGYEQSRLSGAALEHMKNIARLKDLEQELQKARAQEDGGQETRQAAEEAVSAFRMEYLNSASGRELLAPEKRHHTAAAEELISYEKKKLEAEAFRLRLEAFKRDYGKKMETVVTLEQLLTYEEEREQFYANDPKNKKVHTNRIRMLREKIRERDLKQPDERRAYETKTADDYFKGRGGFSESLIPLALKGFKESVGRGERRDVIEANTAEVSMQEQAAKLAEMERRAQSGEGLYQLYQSYDDQEGFRKSLSPKNAQDVSIEDMIRNEQYLAYKESEKNWFYRGLMKNWFMTGASSVSHMERYERLMSKKDGSYADMLAEYEAMGGGAGFQAYLKETAAQWVTPQMILAYEEGRKEAAGSKHARRIEFLEQGAAEADEEKRKEYLRQYEEMAATDNEGSWGKAKSALYRTGTFERRSRYERTAAEERAGLSLKEILEFDETEKKSLVGRHKLRLEKLRSEGTSETEKVDQYEGRRFQVPGKEIREKVEEWKAGNDYGDRILQYEISRREEYERQKAELDIYKKNLSDMILKMSRQLQACRIVLDNVEAAIRDPMSLAQADKSEAFKAALWPDGEDAVAPADMPVQAEAVLESVRQEGQAVQAIKAGLTAASEAVIEENRPEEEEE